MAIFGVGCFYGNTDVSYEFVKKGVACTGYDIKRMEYFTGLFKEIQKGDTIVLKTFDMRSGMVSIKAVGIVTNPKFEKKDNNVLYGVDVNWLKHTPTGIIHIQTYSDGGWHSRHSTIYKEYNPGIIMKIEKLVKKYK